MIRRFLAAAVLLVALAGCASAPGAAVTLPTLPASTPAAVAVAAPVSVSIPVLGVSADVVSVGLAVDGSMEIPPVQQVGWYDRGPKPGEVGPSVLAGHVNWDGVVGPFARIGQLADGDKIIVTTGDEQPLTFVVYRVESFTKTTYDQHVRELFGPTQDRQMALVTCSGTVSDHEYSDNTVVLAHAV